MAHIKSRKHHLPKPPAPDDQARARTVLFESDASIQVLTAPGADHAAVLRLTGIYHDLLRRWAEA